LSAWVKLSITALFWAGAFFSAKWAVDIAPPVTTAFLRFSLAGFLLLALAAARKQLTLPRSTFLGAAGMAVVGIFIYNMFFFEGLSHTSALNGSLIASANPAITALLARIWRKERTSLRQWFGILVSFLGVVLVISGGSLRALLHFDVNPGDLFIVGSATCWAVYSILARGVLAKAGSIVTVTFTCIAGAILLSPFAFQETSTAWQGSGVFWACILYMAVFPSVVAYVWWNDGVREIGPARSAIFINLVPVFVMAISVLMGRLPAAGQIAGGALVLAGVYLTASPGRKAKTPVLQS
jgi:drug/metabolite transporter (DMT)-like permease